MIPRAGQGKVQDMKRREDLEWRRFTAAGFPVIGAVLLMLAAPDLMADGPTAAAAAAYNAYVSKVEARLDEQHGQQQASAGGFLASEDWARLRKGELIIDQITPVMGAELPGALLHDWRGTAFIAGAKGADFEKLMRDFSGYPKTYAPEVLTARVLAHDGDHYQVTMRVRQQHVLTVVMDTAYDVRFGNGESTEAAAQRGYSTTRSTSIAEIDWPGTTDERALSPAEANGFLWRLNTYWSYEERDGGLYIQIESVSLSRSIPVGLGWAVAPFIESVPREALEFTLRATSNALQK